MLVKDVGELKKAVETLLCGSCSLSISHSPKLALVFLINSNIVTAKMYHLHI